MKLVNVALLAGATATLAQDYAGASSYGGDSYQAPESSSYGADSYESSYSGGSSYKPSSDGYESSSYDSSKYGGDYSQKKSGYSYDTKMPSYGKESASFVDAWFTFNVKGEKVKEVPNSGARVTIKKGENAQIILEGIFEDDNDFAKANFKPTSSHMSSHGYKKNVNCANKVLGYDEKDAGCVTDYSIGVEFATGASTKKYSGYNSYNKHDPAVVALNSYGHAPVTTPSVKLVCHEVKSAEPTEGAFGEWNDLRTSVAAKKIKAAYFSDFSTNTFVDEGKAFDPPIFSNADYNACWHARGAPHHVRVGTCLKDTGTAAPLVENTEDLYSTYPCFPIAISATDSASEPKNAGGKFNCPLDTTGTVGPPYCSSVENLGGCFPGCKAGEPKDAQTAIDERGGTGTFVEGKLFLAGHCGWPREAACHNKPRAIKCTAVIELGFAASRSYDSSPRGYNRDRSYKLSK